MDKDKFKSEVEKHGISIEELQEVLSEICEDDIDRKDYHDDIDAMIYGSKYKFGTICDEGSANLDNQIKDLIDHGTLVQIPWTNDLMETYKKYDDSIDRELTGDDYVKRAQRYSIPDINNNIFDWMRESIANDIEPGHVLYGCLGLSGEVGEFVDIIKKSIFHKTPFDETHAKKELGDICWYIQEICHAFGWSLNEIFNMNLEKLKNRYPNGFNVEDANNRKEGDI